MDWSHLKVALAVSRGGSLTSAAQLLGMDQTTAGRRLNALEDQLGVALFVRAKSGFLPTEQGQLVVERALKVEAEIDRMAEDIAASQAGAFPLAASRVRRGKRRNVTWTRHRASSSQVHRAAWARC